MSDAAVTRARAGATRSAFALGLAWLPVLAWLALIFVLSSLPDEHGGLDVGKGVPKLAHLAEYGILGLLVARAVTQRGGPLVDRRTLLPLLAIALYAVSDELHQAFVPDRTPAVTDVAIDTLGGLLGMVGWRLLARRRAGLEGEPARGPAVPPP